MAASFNIVSTSINYLEIDGMQHKHDKQYVQVVLKGSQTVNQANAATPTTLLRGSAIGVQTSGGLALLVNNANTDGTQTIVGILEDTTETANGNVVVPVAVTGSFLANKILFGGSDVVTNHFNQYTGVCTDTNTKDLFVEGAEAYPTGYWNS